MQRRSRIVIGAAALAGAAALGTAGVAVAGGIPDDEPARPINAAARPQAEAAALDHTGGGRVTGTEEGDEESFFEVEVTRPDGSAVDVQLDRDFKVVGQKVDAAEGA